MPSFTLADIQAAADEKYGPTVIELEDGPVVLVNPLRMSKATRQKFMALGQPKEGEAEIDVDEKLAEMIRLATKPADAKRLLAAVGGDLAQLKEIVELWTKASQLGEASASPS